MLNRYNYYIGLLFISINIFAIEGTLRNFKIPLFSGGSKNNKGFIKGQSAKFHENNIIEIEKPDASLFVEEMDRLWRFRSKKCFFKKDENILNTSNYVQIESSGIYLDGEGFEWKLNEGVFVIQKHVTVDVERGYNKNRNNEK